MSPGIELENNKQNKDVSNAVTNCRIKLAK